MASLMNLNLKVSGAPGRWLSPWKEVLPDRGEIQDSPNIAFLQGFGTRARHLRSDFLQTSRRSSSLLLGLQYVGATDEVNQSEVERNLDDAKNLSPFSYPTRLQPCKER